MMKVVMGKAGRVVIPASIRKLLSLSEGAPLEVLIRDNIIELHDRRRKIEDILRAFSKRLKADCGSLANALIEERRTEAAREAAHDTAG